MDYLILILGLLVGFFLGWFFNKSKSSGEVKTVSETNVKLTSEIGFLQEKIQSASSLNNQLTNNIQLLEKDLLSANLQVGKLESELENLRNRFDEHKAQVKEVQAVFKDEFKNLASDILKEQSKDFSDRNIDLLKPFREQLSSFEEKVNTQIKESIDRAASFREQVEQLKNMNIQISQEAHNLTNALKGDNKQQGNWGELILEKVLESSGLENGIEYKTQVSTVNGDDARIQPDVVVYLPDDKHIIIDAKVSLIAFEKYVNADNEADRVLFLKEHLNSVKSHVKGLSEKKYQTGEGLSTPDFILLFIPIEASFGVAIREDVSLFNYAWERNIVMVSPSTLLATLKTIASLWKQEKQNRNVLLIAEESGKLYDKFVGMIKDLEDIQRSFDRTSKQFDEVNKKLHTGKGNIVGRIEKIKTLGAKATKQIDQHLLDD